MADLEKATPDTTHSPAGEEHVGQVALPSGWKYKSPKFGSKKIPWFASPEAQITLVALVCFMCPGGYSPLTLDVGSRTDDAPQACSTPSVGSEAVAR